MLHEVVSFREQIEQSLEAEDLTTLKEVSTQCEAFMRANLPTLPPGADDLVSLVDELEQLVDVYSKAVTAVSLAREETVKQITSLGKNRSNTKTYLDVARHLNP